MTLRELREAHPTLFMEQDWFDGERFMQSRVYTQPNASMPLSIEPERSTVEVNAAYFAGLYVQNLDDPIWERFIWTSDFDHMGQRIYVGGIGQAKKPGFQIHRHLEITSTWGWPCWT